MLQCARQGLAARAVHSSVAALERVQHLARQAGLLVLHALFVHKPVWLHSTCECVVLA